MWMLLSYLLWHLHSSHKYKLDWMRISYQDEQKTPCLQPDARISTPTYLKSLESTICMLVVIPVIEQQNMPTPDFPCNRRHHNAREPSRFAQHPLNYHHRSQSSSYPPAPPPRFRGTETTAPRIWRPRRRNGISRKRSNDSVPAVPKIRRRVLSKTPK